MSAAFNFIRSHFLKVLCMTAYFVVANAVAQTSSVYVQTGHLADAKFAKFSLNDRVLISSAGYPANELIAWDVVTQRQIKKINRTADDNIDAFDVSPSGGAVAHVSGTELLVHKVWEDTLISRLDNNKKNISALAFSNSGNILAVVTREYNGKSLLRFFNPEKMTLLKYTDLGIENIKSVKFSPSDRKLAILSSKNDLYVLETSDLRVSEVAKQALKTESYWKSAVLRFLDKENSLSISNVDNGDQGFAVFNIENKKAVTALYDSVDVKGADQISVGGDGKYKYASKEWMKSGAEKILLNKYDPNLNSRISVFNSDSGEYIARIVGRNIELYRFDTKTMVGFLGSKIDTNAGNSANVFGRSNFNAYESNESIYVYTEALPKGAFGYFYPDKNLTVLNKADLKPTNFSIKGSIETVSSNDEDFISVEHETVKESKTPESNYIKFVLKQFSRPTVHKELFKASRSSFDWSDWQFSPDGSNVIGSLANKAKNTISIRIYSVSSGIAVASFEIPYSNSQANRKIVFNKSGQIFYIAHSDKAGKINIFAYPINGNKSLFSVPYELDTEDDFDSSKIFFSDDNEWMVVGKTRSNANVIYSAKTGSKLTEFETAGPLYDAVLFPRKGIIYYISEKLKVKGYSANECLFGVVDLESPGQSKSTLLSEWCARKKIALKSGWFLFQAGESSIFFHPEKNQIKSFPRQSAKLSYDRIKVDKNSGRIFLYSGYNGVKLPLTIFEFNESESEYRLLGSFAFSAGGIEDVYPEPSGKFLIVRGREGQFFHFNLATKNYVLASYLFNDLSMASVSPEGFYDVRGDSAEQKLLTRKGEQVLTAENFRDSFYRPDQIRAILNGSTYQGPHFISSVKPPPEIVLKAPPAQVFTPSMDLDVSLFDRGGGIGAVQVFVNGSSVSSNSARDLGIANTASQNSNVRSVRAFLVPGLNEIKVIAFNQEGSASSNPASASVQYLTSVTRKPNLYAIVAGIQEFRNPALNLAYPVADAKAIKAVLDSKATGLFEKVVVDFLSTPADTSKQSILERFANLRAQVQADDVFVFYAASHGVIDGDLSGKSYYLITSNVGSTSTTSLAADAISQRELREAISRVPATKKLIILDTCQAGDVGAAILSRGLDEDAAVKHLSRSTGTAVIAASTARQQALEGYQGHGLFTYVLLQALAGGKADPLNKGFVTSTGLADYLEYAVPELAEKVFNYRQYPTLNAVGQSFPIVKTR